MAVWLSRSRATIIEGAQAGAVRFDSIPKSSSATPDKPERPHVLPHCAHLGALVIAASWLFFDTLGAIHLVFLKWLAVCVLV